MAVEALQLGEIDSRRGAARAVQVEPGDGLLGGDDLVVAVRPAEPQQVVSQRGGKIPHVAVGLDAEGAMTLGQLGPVGPVNQRDVGEGRRLPAQRRVELVLAECVGQVIVAADHVGHAHVVVVHHHRQHVGRGPVGPQQHHVVELRVGHGHRTLDPVVDPGLALQRHLDPDHRIDTGRCLGGVAVPPAAVVELLAALGPRGLAHGGQFFRRTVAAIGPAFGQQAMRRLDVALGAPGLVEDLAIMIEFQPVQSLQDGVDGLLGGAFAVGVLDPEMELTAVVPGVEPIEQGGAGAADMQEAGRRGGETGDGGHVVGQSGRRER